MFHNLSTRLRRPSSKIIPFSVEEASTSAAVLAQNACLDVACTSGCRRWLRRQFRRLIPTARVKPTGILKSPIKVSPGKTDLLQPGAVGVVQEAAQEVTEEDVLPTPTTPAARKLRQDNVRAKVREKKKEGQKQEEESSLRPRSGQRLCWTEDNQIRGIEARGDSPVPPPVTPQLDYPQSSQEEADQTDCCCFVFLRPLQKWFH